MIAISNVLYNDCVKAGVPIVRCQFASVQGCARLKKPKRVMKLPAVTESSGTATSKPAMPVMSENTGQRHRPRSIWVGWMRPLTVVKLRRVVSQRCTGTAMSSKINVTLPSAVAWLSRGGTCCARSTIFVEKT